MFSNLLKITVLSLIVSQAAMANEVVLSEKEVTLPVDISTSRLHLSRAGYSMAVVKVLIPELAEVTFLNHRNNSAGAPCMSTYDTFNPHDVIQNNPAVEQIKFTIKLIKYTQLDEENKVCLVTMSESISGKIRGFDFNHQLEVAMPNRHVDDCK